MLPGGASRSSADLAALEAAAAREVAAADGLLLLAWELADGDSGELAHCARKLLAWNQS